MCRRRIGMSPPPPSHNLQNLYKKLSAIWKFRSNVPWGCFRPGLGLHSHPLPRCPQPRLHSHPSPRHPQPRVHPHPSHFWLLNAPKQKLCAFFLLGLPIHKHCIRYPLGTHTLACPPLNIVRAAPDRATSCSQSGGTICPLLRL